jgi:hypothetical protein
LERDLDDAMGTGSLYANRSESCDSGLLEQSGRILCIQIDDKPAPKEFSSLRMNRFISSLRRFLHYGPTFPLCFCDTLPARRADRSFWFDGLGTGAYTCSTSLKKATGLL